MAKGYTNYFTNILEAVFGISIAPMNHSLLRHTRLMARVFARAVVVAKLRFSEVIVYRCG